MMRRLLGWLEACGGLLWRDAVGSWLAGVANVLLGLFR
jgi:hypothetical protein